MSRRPARSGRQAEADDGGAVPIEEPAGARPARRLGRRAGRGHGPPSATCRRPRPRRRSAASTPQPAGRSAPSARRSPSSRRSSSARRVLRRAAELAAGERDGARARPARPTGSRLSLSPRQRRRRARRRCPRRLRPSRRERAARRSPGGAQGELSPDDRQALRASIGALPVRDPGLDMPVGPAPALALEGAADPQRAHAERAKVEDAARTALADGPARSSLQPAGEEQLVPRVPPEKLRAAIAPAPSVPPAAPAAPAPRARRRPGGIDHRPRAARRRAAGGRGRRGRGHACQGRRAGGDRGRGAAALAGERDRRSSRRARRSRRPGAAARGPRSTSSAAGGARPSTTRGEGSLTRADDRLRTDVEKVARSKTDADAKAATHIETGERDAERARRAGEEKAAAERKRGEQETSRPDRLAGGEGHGLLRRDQARHHRGVRGGARRGPRRDRGGQAARGRGDRPRPRGDRRGHPHRGRGTHRDRRHAARRLPGAARSVPGRDPIPGREGAGGDRRSSPRISRPGCRRPSTACGAALDAALGLLEKGLLAAVEGYRAAVAGALKFANGVVQALRRVRACWSSTSPPTRSSGSGTSPRRPRTGSATTSGRRSRPRSSSGSGRRSRRSSGSGSRSGTCSRRAASRWRGSGRWPGRGSRRRSRRR